MVIGFLENNIEAARSVDVVVADAQLPGMDAMDRVARTLSTICPYRGLLHFREKDAPFFFGPRPGLRLPRPVSGRSSGEGGA